MKGRGCGCLAGVLRLAGPDCWESEGGARRCSRLGARGWDPRLLRALGWGSSCGGFRGREVQVWGSKVGFGARLGSEVGKTH